MHLVFIDPFHKYAMLNYGEGGEFSRIKSNSHNDANIKLL
jgi:hypothetical protein